MTFKKRSEKSKKTGAKKWREIDPWHIGGTLESWYDTVDSARYKAVECHITWCHVDIYKSIGFYSEWDGNQLENV